MTELIRPRGKTAGANPRGFMAMPRNHLFIAVLLVPVTLLSGCASEFNLATGKQESYLYGTDKEVAIGDQIARQLEHQYKLVHDVDANARVERILNRIVAVCDRQDIVYVGRIIDDDVVNAVSLPGGYVYVFRGLLEKVENDNQLAGVIAHEVGHITARHAMKRLQASYGYMLLQVLAVSSGDRDAVAGVNALLTTAFLAYSRQDEFQADQLGVKYMKAAGYDPNEMIGVLGVLRKEGEREHRPVNYFRTHPYLNERQAVVNKEITGTLSFKDYLNLTGSDDADPR